MRVIRAAPGKAAEVVRAPDDEHAMWEWLRREIGGTLTLPRWDVRGVLEPILRDYYVVIADDDGMEKRLPLNRTVYPLGQILGPMLVLRCDAKTGDFIDLAEDGTAGSLMELLDEGMRPLSGGPS